MPAPVPEVHKLGAAGWSSPVARQAHNLKVVGSNPTPATIVSELRPSPLLVAGFCVSGAELSRGHRNSPGAGQEGTHTGREACAVFVADLMERRCFARIVGMLVSTWVTPVGESSFIADRARRPRARSSGHVAETVEGLELGRLTVLQPLPSGGGGSRASD